MSKETQTIVTLVTVLALTVSMIAPASSIDYLNPGDFQKTSWSKTVDYLEYVDVYAASHGKPRPPAGAHAYLYMTYVNHLGLQMLYAGLQNITMGLGRLTLTVPLQTFMMHYKTEDLGRDSVVASSYVMLLAYNETESNNHVGSPDRNDTLYASFSMGYDLSSLISTDTPALNSKTKIIPLESSGENSWHWGMTYTNLTAIWWRVDIDPEAASYRSVPVAVSVYEELTFTYDLTFDVDNNNATITSNYVIGRMTDLWVIDTWWWIFPVIVHYNSTGCYRLNRSRYSDETIHDFLHSHGISMSIVLFQASAALNHQTQSSVNGQNISDSEIVASNDTISTFTDEGERIFDADFTVKNSYLLYNFTSGLSNSYPAITRTAHRGGFSRNPIFQIHTFLMRYIPLALAHMDRPLYDQARNQLLNMTYADYFYIISYPTYDGYKIEHDPTYTVYLTIASDETANPLESLMNLLAIIAVIAIIATAAILMLKRRRK